MAQRTGRKNNTIDTTNVCVSRLMSVKSKRVLFVLQNVSTGTQKISISFGQDAVSGQGLVLSPGGIYQESRSEGFEPTNDDIYAVGDAAGGVLSVVERVESEEVR